MSISEFRQMRAEQRKPKCDECATPLNNDQIVIVQDETGEFPVCTGCKAKHFA